MRDALAGLAVRRGKPVLALAAAIFVAAAAFSLGIVDRLDPRAAEDPGGEAATTTDRLERAGYRETGVVVLARNAPADEGGSGTAMAQIHERLAGDRAIHSIADLSNTRQLDYVSTDGSAQYMNIALAPTDARRGQDAAARIAARLTDLPNVLVGGPAPTQAQVSDVIGTDLRNLLLIGLPAVFLLSLLLLRRPAAAVLPPLIGALAVACTLAALRIAEELGSISIFALNLTTGIALALAAGFSLFVVARHRVEISGADAAATRRTLASAGQPVLFSALALALATLLVFPQPVVYSIGLGGALAALSAAAATLTVLPELLVALGARVGPPSQGPAGRFPGRTALAASIVVLLLGIPFYNVGLAGLDPQALPADYSARQVDDVLRADFDPFRDTPIVIALTDADSSQVLAFAERVARLDGIDRMLPAESTDGRTSVIQAFAPTPPTSTASRDTVRAIRDIDISTDVRIEVAGAAARATDFHDATAGRLPLATAEDGGQGLETLPPKTTVAMLDGAYEPARIRVKPGSRVTWVNSSDRANTAETGQTGFFQFDREKLRRENRFDIHTVQPGEAESVVFDKPGLYRYHSSLDTDMRGTVEVVAPVPIR